MVSRRSNIGIWSFSPSGLLVPSAVEEVESGSDVTVEEALEPLACATKMSFKNFISLSLAFSLLFLMASLFLALLAKYSGSSLLNVLSFLAFGILCWISRTWSEESKK